MLEDMVQPCGPPPPQKKKGEFWYVSLNIIDIMFTIFNIFMKIEV